MRNGCSLHDPIALSQHLSNQTSHFFSEDKCADTELRSSSIACRLVHVLAAGR
jgi:hypothetical protein